MKSGAIVFHLGTFYNSTNVCDELKKVLQQVYLIRKRSMTQDSTKALKYLGLICRLKIPFAITPTSLCYVLIFIFKMKYFILVIT